MSAQSKPRLALVQLYSSFVQIARRHLAQLVAQEQKLRQALKQSSESEAEIYRRTGYLIGYNEQDALITIVFAAMAVEAMMYDYIEDRYGEQVFTEEFKPLSIPLRWAKLISSETRITDPKSTASFKMLSQLVRNRNKLVHFRTIVLNLDSDADVMRTFHDYNLLRQAKQADETIDAVLADLAGLVPDSDSEFAVLLNATKSNTSETGEGEGRR